MKSAVEKVLEAEKEAARLLEEARENSQERVRGTRSAGEACVWAAKERAKAKAEVLLHDAAEEAELEARRVRAEAETRAERTVGVADNLDLTFLSSHIDQISGIPT